MCQVFKVQSPKSKARSRTLSLLSHGHLIRPAATFSPSDTEKGIEAERESMGKEDSDAKGHEEIKRKTEINVCDL